MKNFVIDTRNYKISTDEMSIFINSSVEAPDFKYLEFTLILNGQTKYEIIIPYKNSENAFFRIIKPSGKIFM